MTHDLRRYINMVQTLVEAQGRHWQEAYKDGQMVIRIANEDGVLVPPDFLYRVMARDEYDAAERTGFFRPKSGERIHASEHPLATYGSGVDTVVVRFRYDDAHWRPKWSLDELYAITNHAIPFTQGTIVMNGDG